MAQEAGSSGPGRRGVDGRPIEHVVVRWVALNVVFVIIWAMSGGGSFWPGWIMLLTAVLVALRRWTRANR